MLEKEQLSLIATSGNLFHWRKAGQDFKASGEIVFGSPNREDAGYPMRRRIPQPSILTEFDTAIKRAVISSSVISRSSRPEERQPVGTVSRRTGESD